MLVCFALAGTTAAFAGWSDFWHRVELDWHRSNNWPDSFAEADREAAALPLAAMASAGWKLQNTLGGQFFETEEQTLNDSGQIKVRWIAIQTPTNRRIIYVLRGTTSQQTAKRVESVQEFVDKLSLDTRPELLLTDVDPPGGSGEYFDAVDRQRKTCIPAPKLPEMPSQTTSN